MNTNKYIVWIYGPTSSGKTTVAEKLLQELRALSVPVIHFDGDEVRDFFGSKIVFSDEDRLLVVKTLVYLANKSLVSGVNVVVSALTAYDSARNYVDDNVNDLIKVYIQCDIETCKLRDPKGLYRAAHEGEIDTLVGFNDKYLPPENPDIIIDTSINSLEVCVDSLLSILKKKNIVK